MKQFITYFLMTLLVSGCNTIPTTVSLNNTKVQVESGNIRVVDKKPSSTPIIEEPPSLSSSTPAPLTGMEVPPKEEAKLEEMPVPSQQPCLVYKTEVYTPDGRRVLKEAKACRDNHGIWHDVPEN